MRIGQKLLIFNLWPIYECVPFFLPQTLYWSELTQAWFAKTIVRDWIKNLHIFQLPIFSICAYYFENKCYKISPLLLSKIRMRSTALMRGCYTTIIIYSQRLWTKIFAHVSFKFMPTSSRILGFCINTSILDDKNISWICSKIIMKLILIYMTE